MWSETSVLCRVGKYHDIFVGKYHDIFVGKYHDIFENVKISNISKIS